MDEPLPLEAVTDGDLARAGIVDAARARRILESLAGHGVTDDDVAQLVPSLLEALKESPDPDRALGNFERWANAVTSRYTHFQYLLRHPMALRIFCNVCGVSQYFSDILVRAPEYFEILANPGVRGEGKSAEALYRELSGFVDSIIRPELKLEAMRRFRQREVLRIGTRDILGLADMPTTAREFSNLADACVQKCVEIASGQLVERYGPGPRPGIAVIAMGKLGGQELNYSSDIDLMFVSDDEAEGQAISTGAGDRQPSDLEHAHKLCELVISGLSKDLANGHLFRVDVRLRPEGRFGALVRTLSSYRTYYESWAEPWERQALIKARPIAGDARLGEAFRSMVTPFVYAREASAELAASIRHNKERMERKAEVEGQACTNVKVGRGGIRDVEFAVQLLQLVLGGQHPIVRTPNTLEAIARLRHIGVITGREAGDLSEDYSFLRTVEHRLQILYELQTQSLPTAPAERRLLGRRLGFADAAEFDEEYARRTERVRRHFETIFRSDLAPAHAGDEWADRLADADLPAARQGLVARLREAGFSDPERALARLQEAVSGGAYGAESPESRRQFLAIAARLVSACVHTGAPDTSLDGIDALAAAVPNRAEFYRSLGEGDLLDRLTRLAAGSPPLTRSLARHLEWLDMLVGEAEAGAAPKDRAEVRAELAGRRLLPDGTPTRKDAVYWQDMAAYLERERLRIGARELWGDTGSLVAAQDLAAVADGALEALLARGVESVTSRRPEAREALQSVALIGLGKLGGAELGYASDWDIIAVYGDDFAPQHRAVEELVETVVGFAQELRVRGVPVEMDPRLRPEGRFGALARTVSGYRAHYVRAAETWERQSLTKARWVAGSEPTAAAYLAAVADAIYACPLAPEAMEEVRHMKRRIEAERLKVGERFTDLKLGHGGMADIEFTTQLWQLRAGCDHPSARATGTVPALQALGAAHVIPEPDAARLAEAYAVLCTVRNRLALQDSAAADTLPGDDARLAAVAVGMGLVGGESQAPADALRTQLGAQMRETRATVERLLHGGRA